MLITAHTLTLLQRCPRQLNLEHQYRRLPYHPTTLLNACLRQALHDLTKPNAETTTAVSTAVNQFLANARYPGLDLQAGAHPYTLAQDYTATIRTVLEYLTRDTASPIPMLTEVPPVQLPDGLLWGFLAHQDLSGTLHRYRCVDRITQTTVARELHSWEVMADLTLSHAPMVLHLISVGARRDSHLHSPWCRAYRSTVIANQIRFQRRTGQSLDPSTWRPLWYGDNPDNQATTWVDLMTADQVFDPITGMGLVRHIPLNPLTPTQLTQVRRDLDLELTRLVSVWPQPFASLPLTRTSCDSPYECPHQAICYSPDPAQTIAHSNLYEVRNGDGGMGVRGAA